MRRVILSFGSNIEPRLRWIENAVEEYGLDPAPSVHVLPYDVACDDTRAGLHGHSAPAVDRLKMFRDDPSRLSAVDFCTALYPSIWNTYAPLADAVLAKPCQLLG